MEASSTSVLSNGRCLRCRCRAVFEKGQLSGPIVTYQFDDLAGVRRHRRIGHRQYVTEALREVTSCNCYATTAPAERFHFTSPARRALSQALDGPEATSSDHPAQIR
jgi:hypothetical protein